VNDTCSQPGAMLLLTLIIGIVGFLAAITIITLMRL
jgi:hypothetical protein